MYTQVQVYIYLNVKCQIGRYQLTTVSLFSILWNVVQEISYFHFYFNQIFSEKEFLEIQKIRTSLTCQNRLVFLLIKSEYSVILYHILLVHKYLYLLTLPDLTIHCLVIFLQSVNQGREELSPITNHPIPFHATTTIAQCNLERLNLDLRA